MTSPPDVAYIIGPGNDHNPELRYSLRSVAANLPHRNIIIVGHKPAWVTNVTHMPTMQASRIKYGNALRNMLAFCENDQLTPTITFFNDDFYAMHHGQPAPIQHRGTIHDMLNRQLTQSTVTTTFSVRDIRSRRFTPYWRIKAFTHGNGY
jgi:hypothetical protein